MERGDGQPNWKLRRQRVLRGWTQDDLADHLCRSAVDLGEPHPGVDYNTVGRWERGVRHPQPHYVRLLCHVFRLSAGQLGLVDEIPDELRWAEVPVQRRKSYSSLGELTYGGLRNLNNARTSGTGGDRPADSSLLDDLATLTLSYGGLRDIVSPATMLQPVTDHLDVLLRTIPRATSSADAARVQVAGAQTAIMAGWLTFNVGQPGQALAHWVLAHELATEAGHADLRAYAVACRSRLHSRVHRGDRAVAPATALALLDGALVAAATSTDSALRSWLLVNRAEQHADAGDARACDRDLDAAVHVIEGPGTRDEVLWAHWSPARLDSYRGNCARLLHRPAEAISVLESVLGQLDSRVIPARTNPLADLAVAYAERREVEHACHLLSDAFTAASGAGYPEGVSRVADLRGSALASYGDMPAVRRLDDLLRADRGPTLV
jgi:transcriptional regulator with XRE-family HTH domain